MRSRYKIAGPNELLVVYGRRKGKKGAEDDHNIMSRARIITGGGTFIVPAWEQYKRMSLEIMTLTLAPGEVNSRQGIPVIVRAVAQVKVGGSDKAMHQAVQGFLSYEPQQMENSLRETLEGHLRGMVGTQTVKELNFERANFQRSVRDQADPDLEAMGFEIKSIVIQEIQDTKGYMDSVGTPEVEQATEVARIATAAANKNARIAEENSRYGADQRRLQVDTELLAETKALQLREAQVREEVGVATAHAEKAGEFALKQEDIRIAEQEVSRRRKILDAEVRETADAELYATEKRADADAITRERNAQAEAVSRVQIADAAAHEHLAQAQAEATATSTQGHADAEAIQAVGVAEGAKIEAIGTAQAEATRLQGLAEAEGREALAEALATYDDRAVRLELIETLPDVVAAAAAPLARAGETTIISSGGKDADGSGIIQMSQDVWAAITLVEQKFGLDLGSMISTVTGGEQTTEDKPVLDLPTKDQ